MVKKKTKSNVNATKSRRKNNNVIDKGFDKNPQNINKTGAKTMVST
jgi:hypothetical protein